MTNKILEDAELILIRESDFAQCFRINGDDLNLIWLCGPDRVNGWMEVGMRGRLEYQSNATRGWWTFRCTEVKNG